MRLADDPTPADPLRDLRADLERSTAALEHEIASLARVHERALHRSARSATNTSTEDRPSCP